MQIWGTVKEHTTMSPCPTIRMRLLRSGRSEARDEKKYCAAPPRNSTCLTPKMNDLRPPCLWIRHLLHSLHQKLFNIAHWAGPCPISPHSHRPHRLLNNSFAPGSSTCCQTVWAAASLPHIAIRSLYCPFSLPLAT